MRKYFTPEEEIYIEQYFGAISAESIGKRLGVSPKSVISKAYKMGLTSIICASGKITANNLATLIGCDFKVIKRWIDNYGLPCSRRPLNTFSTRRNILIDPVDFWDWAKDNKEKVNFLGIEKNSIVPEPEWVDDERRNMVRNPRKQKKVWTQQDEIRLWNMYYTEGLPQKIIATKFNVSRVSIEKKLRKIRDKGGQNYISSISN